MTQEVDARPIHVKLISTTSGTRFCTVLPSVPEEHDETVWRFKSKAPSEYEYTYDGPSLMQSYIETRMDQSA